MAVPNEVNFIVLNMVGTKRYDKGLTLSRKKLLWEYLANLSKFTEKYFAMRYGVKNMKAKCLPVMSSKFPPIKTYEDVKAFDLRPEVDKRWGRQIQMYFAYGLDLAPNSTYDGTNYAGYCEGWQFEGTLKPGDMCYADMPRYDKHLLFGWNPYKIYEEFGRVVFHELDHQWGRIIDHLGWINCVHAAKQAPKEYWDLNCTMTSTEPAVLTCHERDSAGNMVYFKIQQDFRKFYK